MQFEWVDIVIIVVIAFSALMGILRGFIKEILSLICWIVAFAVAFHFQAWGAELGLLKQHIGSSELRSWASFIGIFIVTLLVMSIIAMTINHLFQKTGITGVDRLLGLAFGVLRGTLIIGAVVAVVSMTSLPTQRWWQASALVGYFTPVANMIKDVLPERIASQLQPPTALQPAQPAQPEQPAQQNQ